MQNNTLARVAALPQMPMAELAAMWEEVFQAKPPKYNKPYLVKRLAYRLQELAYGGLKTTTVKRLQQLGEQLDGGKKRVRSRRADDRPVAGTRLIREWQGTPHEVIVQPDHFEYRGTRYKSLSSVARAITGTVWNGWAFFGLRKSGVLA